MYAINYSASAETKPPVRCGSAVPPIWTIRPKAGGCWTCWTSRIWSWKTKRMARPIMLFLPASPAASTIWTSSACMVKKTAWRLRAAVWYLIKTGIGWKKRMFPPRSLACPKCLIRIQTPMLQMINTKSYRFIKSLISLTKMNILRKRNAGYGFRLKKSRNSVSAWNPSEMKTGIISAWKN